MVCTPLNASVSHIYSCVNRTKSECTALRKGDVDNIQCKKGSN